MSVYLSTYGLCSYGLCSYGLGGPRCRCHYLLMAYAVMAYDGLGGPRCRCNYLVMAYAIMVYVVMASVDRDVVVLECTCVGRLS